MLQFLLYFIPRPTLSNTQPYTWNAFLVLRAISLGTFGHPRPERFDYAMVAGRVHELFMGARPVDRDRIEMYIFRSEGGSGAPSEAQIPL